MLRDFVLETCNAPGTATTVTLLGAPAGRLSFAQAFSSGSLCFYYMDDGTQAEWAFGTFTAGTPNTFARPSFVTGNTAGTTAKLNFAGTTRIYNEVPASHVLYTDNVGTFKPSANFSVDSSGNLVAAGSLTAGPGGSFLASLGASGYQMLPSGLIRQWGLASTTTGGLASIGYSIAFPSAALSFQGTITGAGGPSAALMLATGTLGLSSTNVWCSTGAGAGQSGVGFFWEVIGK